MKEAHELVVSAEQSILPNVDVPEYRGKIADIQIQISDLKTVMLEPAWRQTEVRPLVEKLKKAHDGLLREIQKSKGTEERLKKEQEAKTAEDVDKRDGIL